MMLISNFGGFDMKILAAIKNANQTSKLTEAIDSITVMAEMVDQNLIVDSSWVHVSFEIKENLSHSCKLTFEVTNTSRREFKKVYLQEWIFGMGAYPTIATSNMITYKSGQYSRPITLFISKFRKDNKNETLQ